LQNFDLGPSLVDEVMKAFGNSGKAERLEKLPIRSRSTEEHENSSTATTPCQSEELKTSTNISVASPLSFTADGSSCENETFVDTQPSVCYRVPYVPTSVTGNNERRTSQNGVVSLKSGQLQGMQEDSPESLPSIPTVSLDVKSNRDFEGDSAAFDIWQQQQQISHADVPVRNPPLTRQQMPLIKSKQLSASILEKKSRDTTPSAAGGKYPAIIGNCSLSPRPLFPHESTVTKNGSSSTLSTSSDERIPPVSTGRRVSTGLVAESSSSLPARSSLVRDSWSKLPHHHPGTKVLSADSSDSESSGNLLQRLKGKASLSRFSGLRLSVDSRTAKSGLPTQNLNVNVHFFNRLREQELQNSARSKDDNDDDGGVDDDVEKLTEAVETDSQKLSASSAGLSSKHLPSRHLDTAGCEALRISEWCDRDSGGASVETTGTAGTSPILSTSHDEVARLSCQSTESHDSYSEHSSIATQPSDEGVYSDDSVAASADELRPRSEGKNPTSQSTATPTCTAIALGISDKHDVFWTCPVNFRDMVNVEESHIRDEVSRAAERYKLQTDLCYEDRMECELNGCVDMYRYFVLIFIVFRFVRFLSV